MKWLFALETEDDLIVLCRLMNTFRRKGVKPQTLAIQSSAGGYDVVVMLEAREHESEHHFHFLRRTEGVRHVTVYRENPDQPASYVFVEEQSSSSQPSDWAQLVPGSRTIFASLGKVLLEIPATHDTRVAITHPGSVLFALAKSTRDFSAAPPE